jgi:hypothetical protein
MLTRLQERLLAPKSIASLAMYRFLFGALLCLSSLRFLSNGWVDRCFGQPTFFFKYYGFEWVQVLPAPWMTVAFVAMVLLSAFVALGFLYRLSIVALFLLFTYVELIDVTNYLNHYYLVSLLAFLMCFMPLGRAYSVDAWLWPRRTSSTVPAWMLYLLRFQVGLVYFFAGMAKLQPDWLLHAQPLGIWLASRTEAPIIGPLLGLPFVPYLMSWAGFLFDTFIVAFLLWRRSRPYAFAVVVVFHSCTHLLFVIGVFPFLMMCNATLFFDPDWPVKLWRRLAPNIALGTSRRAVASQSGVPGRWSSLGAAAISMYCLLQLVLPVRALAYPGNVLWHEQGMRYAWRVMVREKNGAITYRVRWKGRERELHVPPRKYLTGHQEREMSGQPDQILQLAQYIAREYETKGYEDVEVRVDALVSLNGRRAVPMIDPDVDLAAQSDGVHSMRWIEPSPDSSPLPAFRKPSPQPLLVSTDTP